MKKIYVFVMVMLVLLLTGCASKEDKAIAQNVISDIENIGTVSLDKAEQIYNVQSSYNELTDTQKKLVKNAELLSTSVIELQDLILEEEIKNDPTNTITEKDLVGIWKEEIGGTHTDYFYFTQNGHIYFMSSKSAPSQSDFTSDYIIGTSYSIGGYNKDTKEKDGEFYCVANKSDISFGVKKDSSGKMVLDVKNSVAAGTYTMTGEKVDTTPSKCLHSGCTNNAASTGDSYYCTEHSSRCLECNCYIDEDAMFCLNCIVEALREMNE